MKWNVVAFWVLVLIGAISFFGLANPFLFCQQEEAQLFISEWHSIRQSVLSPGGFCSVAGQFLTQFYTNLFAATLLNATMCCLVSILFFLLLQQIAPRRYHLLLALIPVLYLLKMQLNPGYVSDGTVGFLFMLLFLYLSILSVRTKKSYGIVVAITVLLYCLLGQLVVLYACLFVLLCFITGKENRYSSFAILPLGCLLSYGGIRMSLHIPLADGIYSLRYQESQFLPESFLYYVWIRLAVVSFVLFVIAYLFKRMPRNNRWSAWLIAGVVVVGLAHYSIACLPDAFDRQNRLLGQLAYRKTQQDWAGIINMERRAKNGGHIYLNYLNLALAEKDKLADEMFSYDQKGAQGLIAPWNGTYYMSALLSDIHFAIDDRSVSESYAMEALTLAKRGGSPRILQRLVEINRMKGEFNVTGKYLGILKKMPFYRTWAENYEESILPSERTNKQPVEAEANERLLSQLDTETRWKAQLTGESWNKRTFDYLACSYLLEKELEKFKTLLCDTRDFPKNEALPIHYQEAVVVWAFESGSPVPDNLPVREECKSRFDHFRRNFKQEVSKVDGYERMHQQYGNTYWFYYYCKQL